MMKTQTINWAPFSDKHISYINSALDNRGCCAEGAIRSGKTIDHCIIFAAYLEQCPDKIHLASGSSMPNAKLNIGDCNGFGLEYLFRGRCHWGKYKGNEALYIYTMAGDEKIIIFVGGGKRNSYQKILGNSYGGWIATEINEHYDSEDSRESFIKVAFGRQAAALSPFFLWDLNPCHPGHKIYADYVDKYKVGFVGGYLYEHFTMADNLSITERRRREIESQYDPGSVWYARDILGQRRVAEGLIYKTFADAPHKYKTDKPNYHFIQAGVDFGGSKSAFAFVASGLTADYSTLTALVSERHPAKGLEPDHVYSLLAKFIERVQGKYGRIDILYPDSAEQTLINGIKSRFGAKSQYGISIRNSIKNEIVDRVRAGTGLMTREDIDGNPLPVRFFYTEDCQTLVDALSTAIYDPKQLKDERLDDGTSDIDTIDAWEYSWERYMKQYARW
jgi:PBSX family phage terminase large subunit